MADIPWVPKPGLHGGHTRVTLQAALVLQGKGA